MKDNKRAGRILLVGLCLAIMLLLISISVKCFAEEISTKVDDNSLKTTTEKVYTYEDIQNRIDSLKSERDGQQNNLNLLNAEIARLEKMIQANTGVNTGSADSTIIYFGAAASTGVTGAIYFDDIVIDDSKYIGNGWRVQQDGAVGSPYQY
jgi:uncharacterized protein YlxW (UPF0749 family)